MNNNLLKYTTYNDKNDFEEAAKFGHKSAQ